MPATRGSIRLLLSGTLRHMLLSSRGVEEEAVYVRIKWVAELLPGCEAAAAADVLAKVPGRNCPRGSKATADDADALRARLKRARNHGNSHVG